MINRRWRRTLTFQAALPCLMIALLVIHPAAADQALELSPALGEEIDSQERDDYHLFPSVEGFTSARFLKDGDRYILSVSRQDGSGTREQRVGISRDMWEITKLHVELVEAYSARRGTVADPQQAEAEWQLRTALKYAARGRYEFSRLAVDDLFTEFPQSPVTGEAVEARESIRRLAGERRALFLPGALFERGGRTDLLIFAGYYGLWAGIATPIALNSESSQAYAVGLISGVPISLGAAYMLSKNSDVSQGRAAMISLGGHLGTWQGIGWAAGTDAEAETVVGAGLLAGVGGIAAATLLTRGAHITEGHGALSGLSLPWGMWYGLVAGIVGGARDNDLITASLVGSDVLVLGTLIGARNSTMSRGRARLISLLGVAGATLGFGVDLLAEVDSDEAIFGIAGAGSVLGLAMGVQITRNYDAGRDFSSMPGSYEGLASGPRLGFRPDPFSGGVRSTVSWDWRF